MYKIYHKGAFLTQKSYFMADCCVATLSISSANKCGYTKILAAFLCGYTLISSRKMWGNAKLNYMLLNFA